MRLIGAQLAPTIGAATRMAALLLLGRRMLGPTTMGVVPYAYWIAFGALAYASIVLLVYRAAARELLASASILRRRR